ncbi:hypothetical protein [Streptomyces sp. NBC_00154]|uniref:hypothetical protein n=1 Tax=Streptomyces sp. NBC_00154 TaxID=2975670 RepID=UPI00224CC78E|nr:hypothetical protein [Streptomyces sp. NBC_00154]MCX5318081.1 hypothetical protein [Streptomyces sp. NBC_00154]
MSRQDAITQAVAAAEPLQQTNSVVDLHTMQDAVQHALNLGATLQDIAAARTPHPAPLKPLAA